jgi:DNA modification methylase
MQTIDYNTGEIEAEHPALAKIDTARYLLAQARDVDEVKDIRDKAEALRLYLRQQHASLEAQNHCAEIKLRAERRAGEILKDTPKNEGGLLRGNTVLPRDDTPTLDDLGISKMQSSRWQAIAALPEDEFEEYIQETKGKGDELTTVGVLTLAKEHKRQEERRQRMEAETPYIPAGCAIEQRDSIDHIPDDSIDLVLTDPPYGISAYGGVTKVGNQIVTADFDGGDDWDSADPDVFLGTLEAWVQSWARVTRPGGAVIAFTDKALISYLWDFMKDAGLKPKNIIAWVKTNPAPAALARRNLISACEYLVWAVKPGAAHTFNEVDGWDRRNAIIAPITGGHEKVDHPTQKPLAVLSLLIALTTVAGETVLDPFAGSGSTGVAAVRLGRTAHLIERDPGYAALARERLAAEQG